MNMGPGGGGGRGLVKVGSREGTGQPCMLVRGKGGNAQTELEAEPSSVVFRATTAGLVRGRRGGMGLQGSGNRAREEGL